MSRSEPPDRAGPLRTPQHLTGPADFAERFAVSRETAGRLALYADLVAQWQKAVQLVAPSTLPEVWHRHMADSAQLSTWIPHEARTFVDLGSGAGFPGLVLAILLAEREGSRFTLVESDQRKAAFLREVVRRTVAAPGGSAAVTVEIISSRIENRETHAKVGVTDVVTARALAPLHRLLSWAVPFFGEKTVGVFPKGRDLDAEIETARRAWSFDIAIEPSMTDPGGRIALITRLVPRTEGSP